MIRDVLKVSTCEAHQSLEARLDFFQRLRSPSDYAKWLSLLYPFYDSAEREMRRFPELEGESFSLRDRLKAPLLVQDLAHFGIPAPNRRISFGLSSLPKALGCLYVLEGSTLGGAMIAKTFSPKWGGDERSGFAFYSVYGSRVRERWQEFGAFLDAFVEGHYGERECHEIVESARLTFRCFEAGIADQLVGLSDKTA